MTRIVDVREQTVPLEAAIRNSLIDFSEMTTCVVAVLTDRRIDGRPAVGFGFNSIGRYTQGDMLRDRFIPRLLNADPDALIDEESGELDPARVGDLVMKNEKPAGHGERSGAVAALEIAVWDVAAKLAEMPLYRLLADRYNGGEHDRDVEVYAAGGYYYPDDGVERLVDEMCGYLDAGYTHLKMKVGGASLDTDIERVEAVLGLVGGDGGRLAVDANGRFDLETAIAYGERMERYGLRWYEEPGDPLDFALLAELGKHYEPPLATAENLFSHQDVRNLLRYAGLRPDIDILQMDPGLSYGVAELDRMLSVMRHAGWSPRRVIPHGGHLMALHMAAGLQLGGNESYPGIFQPFGGFGLQHEVVEGAITIADEPGIGLELKTELEPVLSGLAPEAFE
ncbi:MAG TPA: enolase C-terminal domain-like protein [Solirubrobacterales bacterium]|nr:enolase C-terminal domain-like protein [Solirubrobacterales bacterium]